MENPDLFNQQITHQYTPDKQRHADLKTADNFVIDDLFDFSNDVVGVEAEEEEEEEPAFQSLTGNSNSNESSNVTALESCNSGGSADFLLTPNLSDELCVPYDDLAELEWLSNFVEESFSTEDLQKMQLISGMSAAKMSENVEEEAKESNAAMLRPDKMVVSGKARSKRTRKSSCNWSSARLLVASPSSSSSETDVVLKKTPKKKDVASSSALVASDSSGGGLVTDGRKCLHCATDKTPQWRTGPMGPKTLCNACGVRYKSGRLVPEYRPASSPTFSLAKHSNSHRKVMELRRQKEMKMSHHQQFLYPSVLYDVSGVNVGGGGAAADYLIHHHNGPDYRQLM